ncbi:MAG: 2-C-methyl-D-erythritol 2,4-cyclodiphosphate synthase [Deltaproteobacteria bacterium]|nr:2-C-methyl-D-erythritol 2,4-cyclodiphosphate synthase [Deltaproteobacteria bacterium]
MKVGVGFDSHRLVEGRSLILGGVEIPNDRGLLGHSDADVLLHTICDAILGALGEGDIGGHFPDTDPAYKNISSMKLLMIVKELASKKGYTVNNIDTTVIMEKPRLKGYVNKMIHNISQVLGIEEGMINIKATTNEGMGFIGRGEGIAAFAVVSMRKGDSI